MLVKKREKLGEIDDRYLGLQNIQAINDLLTVVKFIEFIRKIGKSKKFPMKFFHDKNFPFAGKLISSNSSNSN